MREPRYGNGRRNSSTNLNTNKSLSRRNSNTNVPSIKERLRNPSIKISGEPKSTPSQTHVTSDNDDLQKKVTYLTQELEKVKREKNSKDNNRGMNFANEDNSKNPFIASDMRGHPQSTNTIMPSEDVINQIAQTVLKSFVEQFKVLSCSTTTQRD